MVSTYQAMKAAGLHVPAPWKHDPIGPIKSGEYIDSKNNAGFWLDLNISKDGDLEGKLEVPLPEDAQKVGTTVKEASPLIREKYTDGTGKIWEDCLSHIALVTHPVQPGQDNFAPADYVPVKEGEYAIALSNFVSALADGDQTPSSSSAPKAPESPAPPVTSPAGGSFTIQDAIAFLRKTGVSLPDNTTEGNLVERICIACQAIEGTNEEEELDDANGATEQPRPIAMSTVVGVAGAGGMAGTGGSPPPVEPAIMLSTNGTIASATPLPPGTTPNQPTSPTQSTPSSPEKPGDVAMSNLQAQNDKLLAIATSSAKQSIAARIKNLIDKGRLTQTEAKELFEPHLAGFQLSLHPETGEPIPGQLEVMLSTLEKTRGGAGHLLNGHSQQAPASLEGMVGVVNKDAFLSLFKEEPQPGYNLGEGLVVEGEDLDKLVAQQMTAHTRQY